MGKCCVFGIFPRMDWIHADAYIPHHIEMMMVNATAAPPHAHQFINFAFILPDQNHFYAAML